MPKYRVNGDIYNIPDDKAAAFEKRYPNATVDIYDNDGEEYTLPVSEKAGFQEQFKNWSYSAPSVPSAPSAPSSKKIDTGENLGPVMPTPEAKDADGNIDWRETARQELEKSVPEAARPNSSDVQVPERPEATTAQEPATASAGEYVNAPITEDKQEVSLQQANREQVADLSSRIDDMLNQAQTASRDIYVQEQEEARKGGVLSTIANAIAASGHNPEGKMEGISDAQQQTLKGATPELQQDIATLEAAKRAMSNAQEVIAEADKSAQEGKFDGFIKGVARGFGDKFFDVHTWDMGVSDTKESAELLRVLTKFDKGEPLSESEQMLLDAKSVELATNAYFGSYIGRGYKAGSVTAQSLPFMIEMAINPASTVGESAQSMLARYAMRRFGKKAIAKAAGIAGRAVGDIAGSAIMAGTTGSIHVAGDAIDRSTGDIKTDVDDGGRTVFVGHEDGESLGKAIAKAFTATAIENHSEMLGEYFSPVLGALGAAGRKVMNKVGLEKAVQFVDDVNASDLAKLINDFQKQTKWNGTIGEYAEEVAGNIENAILVGDQTLDTDSDTGVFNLSQNIDTFLGVSLMGGAFSVVRTVGYRTPKYRARKDMIKARDKAAELYGEERWKDIEDGLANAGDEGITEYLTDAILNETDPGKKAALLDYAGKIKAYEGTLKGNEKHREISGPEMTDLETSYENGYTLATPQEVNDAKMMFEYQQQRLRDNLNLDDIDIDDVLFGNEMGSLTDEQKSVAMDYLNAKATYDGVLDHVRDDLDTRVAAVANAIDSHVNVDNGQIVTATLKQDDRKVYIIGGNVVMTPDGTMVDSQKSEKYIIIKDAETGQISSVDPTQILRLDGNLDPVKEKENARQQIMQTLAQQEADKIDGVLPFNQGDTYQLTAEDGQSFPVQVVANEQGVIDNGDGTVNVVLNNDIDSTTGQPRITQMAKEQIQSMAEATNIARLQQHELQKAEERMRAAEEERTSRTQGAPYHINDRITITDAKTGELLNAEIVSEITDDGKYEVEANTGDGEIVMMYLSPEELSQMNAQLVSAKIIDAEPEMVEQEQPEIEQETALSRIPVDKNGDAQFEEAQPSDTWKALVEMNEGDAAEAEDTAKQMYDNATKELDKAQKAKPKAGATVMEIQKNKAEYKSKLDKLQAKVDYWGKVLSFPEAERKPAAIAAEDAKTEAMQQANDNLAKGRKIMQEKGTYYKEDSKLGDYLNFEDFALRMIANGRVKFVWKSDPNNSAIKGLGAHLGFEDNENERKRVFSILANADKGGLRPDEAAQELAEIYNSSNDNESIDTMQALDTILDIIRSYGGKTRDMMNAAIAAHADVGMDERGYMEDRQGNPINPDGTLYAESVSSIDEITDEDFTEPTRNIALPKIPENVDNAIGANGKPIIIKKNIFKRNSQVHPEVSPQQAREILSSALYRPDLYGQNQKTSRPYNWIVISTKDSAGQNRLVVLEVNENKDNVEIIHWYNARNSSIEQIKRQAQKEGGLILILPSETEEAGGLSSRQSGLSSEGKDTNIFEESNIETEKPVAEQITEQRKVVNTEPTEAQKEAGNYRMGHVKIDGMDVTIENPKGSIRRGTDADGKKWESEMHYDYGYIRGTKAVDNDHIDIFLSDNPETGNVFVVDQVNPKTGEFDESKVMYGFVSEQEARDAYLSNYEEGWKGLGKITEVTKEEFKKWIDSSHRKTKPFTEYKSVKPVEAPSGPKQVNVESLMGVLSTTGQAKLSDHTEDALKSVAEEDTERQEAREKQFEAAKRLYEEMNEGDVLKNDNGGIIRIVKKQPNLSGYEVEINNSNFAGTVPIGLADMLHYVAEEGYYLDPEGGKAAAAEEQAPSTDSVTIEPATYTTKTGKTLNMFRVNPGRELSKDEWRAVSKFLKENRGWKDRENGGFMVRTEGNANELANLLRDADAMSEARPVSLTDMQKLGSVSVTNSDDAASTSEDSLPEWGYELVTYSDGHSYLSRYKRMPNGIPVYDGRHIAEANDPETLKAILQHNNLYDLLSETDKSNLDYRIEIWQFENRVKTEGINGLKLNDKVFYKGKEATVHDFEDYGDHRPVLDTGLAPVIYEVAESWDAVQKIEAPAATPAADEQSGETQPERPVNPSGNKLVTDERYAELRMKMMQKLQGQLNLGIDPEILAIGTEMAVYHIEKGARKFVEYAKAMIADLSDAIRPYLKAFYNGARDLPEMQESGLSAEMDSYADVQAVDVANFDKETTNIISTVEMVEKEAEVEQQAKVGAEKLHRARNIADKTVTDSEKKARRAFSRAVATEMIEAVSTGVRPFDSIVDLRKLAEKCGMTLDKLGSSDILLQELVEDGLVTAARDIIESKRYGGSKSREAYNAIVQLYEMQPTISQRSSTRIKMQQYSTPLPMAFVADMFAFHPGSTGSVLEPTAGNGMLVFAIPAERVHANELDETRLANLREQGFREVTSQDGALPFEGEYDAVIANPPFGSAEAKEYDGVSISGLDPQIALNALASMSDTGKAAIIVGGNLEYASNGALKGGKKAFFSYLYDHYNVRGIIDMSGDLYKRQGTTFPTMMILIDGRRSEAERAQTKVYPPVKSAAIGKVNNFEELYDTVISLLSSNRKTNGYETVRTQELGLFDNNGSSGTTSPDGPRMEHNENDSDVRRGTERTRSDRPSGRNGNGGIQRTEKQSGGRTPGAADAVVSGTQTDTGGRKTASDERGNDAVPSGDTGNDGRAGQLELEGIPSMGTSGTGVGITEPVKKSKEKPKEERKLTDEKLHYVQHSSAFSLESVAPAAMVEAMDATLAKIEDKYGKSIDEFVTDELGYDSITAMHNALAAEQVDSVAMAIDQMKQGQALVIGDQTGVGKGRQMAALIRWAVRQGTQPIFITQKATLFTDIYRDLVDIGSGDLNPFIFNTVETSKDAETGETVYGGGVMKDGNGVLVHRAPTSAKLSEIFESGELPAEYDFAVLTYSQVNTGDEASAMEAYNEKKKNGARAAKPKNIRSNPKADFLRKIAKDNYLFLDESHTAAGDSKSGYYLQSLVKDAAAVTFASATFAKRPDTMPLYALRTAMSKAQLGEGKSLIGIIKRGGVTLQEIMSRSLTAAGQMVRRERDMSDVRTDWETVTDPKTVEKARENYDKTIEAFNDIIEFQSKYVTPLIDALSSGLALMGSQAKHKKGTKKMGIDNVPFASKTYNYTKQLMLALKTDAIIDRVAKEIQEGRHPVIALESTMEGLLKDSYMPGDVVENPTFAASLLRGLDTVLQYTVTDENGKETHRSYSPSELGEEGARAYYELRDKIIEATSDIYISPLDAIINGLKERGFKVGELTGRTLCAEIDAEGRTVVRKRTDTDKLKMMQDFNSGALDVLVLNKSASTGISLHASKKFKDQRQRSMIIAQPLSDINDYMQMIGRIDRTGQVHRGYYINLALPVPAEQRFNMMLSTKLKSLNANTTTSQDSESNSVDAPDLLNKYGSQVVVEYLRDNPAIYTKLGCPLKDGKGQVKAVDLDEYKPSEDDARKITGYVALLSTKEQQDFYDDVIRRYNDLINYLNETGTNDLKITVMPLEAKTVEKSVSSEGAEPDGDNPFAQHAFVEKVEMNVLSKPMSADEIRKTIKKLNGDKAGTERRTEILNRLREESQARLNAEDERYEAAKAKGEEDIAKRTAVIMAKEKMSDEEKKQAIDRFTETIHEKIETTHEDNHKKIIASANSLMRRMMSFDVEKTYMIADNLGNGGQSLFCSPAIFCGFKSKESKITASTTIAVFAPLDGRRRIEVKMSDMTACNQIIDLTELNYQTAAETTLSNWDSQIPNETRKTGYILTGNILQAIADTSDEYGNYTGQLVSFTDDEGNVRDGILMPDQWTPALLPSAGVPINARAADIMKGRSFSSTDGSISIQTGYFRSAGEPMYFELSVPKSKAKGGKYFLNDELLSLLHGEFRTRSGKMQATIWPDNIKAVLDLLSRMGVRVADSPRGQEDSRRFRDGYHGSIANFDAFDISHAGEGEGFQSHGFGHYIAFNKETAESYAWNNAFEHLDKEGLLSPELSEIMRSDEFDTYEQMVERYDSLLKEKQKDAEDELELSKREDAGDTSLINMMKRDFDRWMSYKPLSELLEDTRYLYTVNIPDDNGHNYIDEMRTLDKSDRKRIADVLRSLPESRLQKATHGPNWLRDGFNTLANVIEREQYAGLEIRRRLVDALGSEKQASEILSKAGFVGYKYNGRADGDCAVIFSNDDISINHKERFRIREDEPPTKTGIGYKVFVLKNGQLYPPMVANPNGESTPVGIWLDADAAPVVGTSKTGRPKVKAGGRGTQGGSGTLAYRPGWHLGVIPYALQFNRKGESGERELFPANFVWAEVEYANDVDYQDEAMSYGYNESGKFQHSLAGLPRVPENGAYTYRTNPDPKTDPWIITGAMKVNRLLTPSEVDEMVRAAGREPQKRQKGAVTDEQIQTLNRNIEAISSTEPSDIRESISELAGRLGENIRIVEDVNELTDSNPKVQRRMRNSFGWYDTETGEIVVVLPNARSVADARATIFHEAVGHKGLRELVGDDRFDDFLDKVYAAASLETRKKIVDLAKQNHWNFRLSTEEYIAGLSETGFSGRENRTWFGKIKDFFLDMLSRAKIALGFNIGDNELRYMLWRTYQMRTSRGILAKANDMAIQQELKVGNFREDQLRGRNGFTENDIAEMETPILESRGTFAKPADAEKWAKENLQGKTFVNSFTGDEINISGHSIKEMLAPKFSKAINEKTHMAAIMSVPDFIETGIPAEIHKDTHGRGYDVMRLYNAIVIDGELYRVKSTVKRYVDGDRYYTYEIQEMELLKGTQTTALGLDDSSRPQLQSSITGANLLKGVKKTNFDEEILSDNDSRFRFRSSGNGVSSNKARDIYEEKTRVIDKNGRKSDTANLMRRLKEAYVDSMQSLKYLQDAISEETGKPVEDFENAYLAENSMSSKNKAQTDIFLTRFFNPIKDAVRELQKEGEDYGDIVRYLMAKHGLERNEVFSKRDAEKDGGVWDGSVRRDYSGLTELTRLDSDTKTPGIGEITSRAERIVGDFEKAHNVDALWDTINKATKETLHTAYVSGKMTKENYNYVRSMFKYYIPLRGWKEDNASAVYDYLSEVRPRTTSIVKAATGRTSISDDPIATIAYMGQNAIIQGNRELMKQKLLNLAINHKTSLLTVSRQWEVMDPVTGVWEERNPIIPVDATAEQIADILSTFEKDMKEAENNGLARISRGSLDTGKHVTQYEGQEHVVRVMRGGVHYCIYVNGNPRAAQAVNGMTNPDAADSWLIRRARAVKNFMARMFTSQNPAFIVTNLSRDLIFAGTAVFAKEDGKYASLYTKNITAALAKGQMLKLIYKFEHDTLDDNIPLEKYFKEFIKNGGETGFTQLNTVDDFKRDIDRFASEMTQGQVKKVTTKIWNGIWDSVEFMNRCAEDATRFSVYMTSRQMGRSIEKSISDAKEVTVNFNRKGSGTYGARAMNFAYIFFNAAVQSLANAGKILYEHPVKATAALMTFSAAGFVAPLLAQAIIAAFGGDDDSYWDLPEWVRRNNFVFYIPWSKNKFLIIPISQELRPFYALGEIAMSVLMGKEEALDGLKSAAGSFMDLLPVDFMGNGGNLAVSLTPTVAQPFAQLVANTDYFGKPIYRRNDWNEKDPGWTKAYKGTNSMLVDATKWLNEVSGGDNVVKGWIDVNPAVVEHLYESYLGGVGKTLNKTVKTLSMIWDPDSRVVRNVPIVSTFIQDADDERTAGSQLNREYNELMREFDKTDHKVKGYKKQIRLGAMEYADKLNEFMDTPEFQRYSSLYGYVSAIRKIKSAIKYSPDEDVETLKQSLNELKSQMVQEMENMQDGNR